ncbi:hypothetical protein [Streptomyces massasporeus]|uniref:hypothetical protein n=1 Tax=Streptomyces massasporeus TaxID=67324 RepID=UPI0033FF40EE
MTPIVDSGVPPSTLTGGCCGALADACATAGVDLANPSARTMAAAGVPGGETHNPVDLVSNAKGPEGTEEVLARGPTVLEADPSVTAVVYADSTPLPLDEVADVLIARHSAKSTRSWSPRTVRRACSPSTRRPPSPPCGRRTPAHPHTHLNEESHV